MTGRPIRLLIADDSEPMRTILRTLLELDRRIAVLAEAPDGAEAVRLVAKHVPDCVLLDLDMPVLDGLAAIPEIKRRTPRCRIVVFSGLDGGETAEQVLAAGADAFLDKPAGLQELAPTIVHACKEAEPRGERKHGGTDPVPRPTRLRPRPSAPTAPLIAPAA